ncbi:MAG: YceH family protein [Thermogutta sp.]|uniref:YceH family protein n=1 Tax=Thermogutta sp. TaxID=1962930 RepID=UPI0019BA5876|nr:DUF480 domain-containing protein [Thermogutta sp.]MBC7353933.1 YceH family protein [Thermogutta sp.]
MNDEYQGDAVNPQPEGSTKRWRPLPAIERRVLGVLVEKAKTVPSSYPMTLNAIVTGCNQKSNRDPVMELTEEVVERALDNLRQMGAVGIVQGMGRVDKYRHYLYEWLGVNKEELAIIAELLLRGPQTEGELRAHASRMDPIPDLPTLRQHLDSLKAKGLIIDLTPPGRGHVVAHNLYPEPELARLRQRYSAVAVREPSLSTTDIPEPRSGSGEAFSPVGSSPEVEELRQELAELKQTVAGILQELATIKKELGLNGES